MTVRADVSPADVYLAVIAGQLRDGKNAEAVPSYDEQAWKTAIARAVRGLTFQPLQARTDSRRA